MREALLIGLLYAAVGTLVAALAQKYAGPFFWDVVEWGSIVLIIGCCASLLLLTSYQSTGRPFSIPAACINLGICLVTISFLLHYAKAADPDQDYIYFNADILNGRAPDGWQGSLNNNSFKPFSSIDSWFCPAKSKPGEPAYLILRSLKVFIQGQVLHGGGWVGKIIPPGAYRVEYQALQDGISYSFVEFLQLLPSDNAASPIQLIDVWKSGPAGRLKVYTSSRTAPFKMIDDPDAFIREP